MKTKLLFILLLVLLLPLLLYPQKRRWKRTRYEVIAGTGVTNFMGELGGADKEGSDYFSDFEISQSRPLLHVGFRYKILEPLSAKASFTYGYIHGDDAKTNEIFRHDRNLKFQSVILEFGAQIEYSLIKEQSGHRYSLRKSKKFSLQALKVNTYIFAGISGFYFNPKAKYEGKLYALQPLCTEGQSIVETRKKYKRFQPAIPIGFGFKYGLTRKISIGLEYGLRFTFTDYIDDVSTSYIDNDWLRREKGDVAAELADPGLGQFIYDEEDQRGDPKNDDTYMFTIVSVTYKLNTGRNGLPKF
ncbi:MAG: hypothetical protein KAT68_15875 [Bacteroidales bacterium]|nr:hypothetical protein [Bacteroidales bacterium]